MRIFDMVTEVVCNLKRKKLRSALTTMGIVIGTFAIVMVWSLSAGLQNFLHRQVRLVYDPASLRCFPAGGVNPQRLRNVLGGMFGSIPKRVDEKDVSTGIGGISLVYFSQKDIDSLRSIPHVQAVRPLIAIPGQWIRMQGNKECLEVFFILWQNTFSSSLIAGEPLDNPKESAIVLPYTYCKALKIHDPKEVIGRTVEIKMGKHPFLYRYLSTGLLKQGWSSIQEKIGSFWNTGSRENDPSNSIDPSTERIFKAKIKGVIAENIFSSTVYGSQELLEEMSRFFMHQPDLFSKTNQGFASVVFVDSPEDVPAVRVEIEKSGMQTITGDDVIDTFRRFFAVIETILTLFGMIALGVATLGIVNTLLISVYERKSEIGIFKALGATKGTIWALFAIEAASVGFIGGIIGLVAGGIAGEIANQIASRNFAIFWQTSPLFYFHWWFFPIILAFTTSIGLLGGFYPAYRASNLEPIEALRYNQ